MAWVTDAEFKQWARLDIDDVVDDAEVAVAVAAAHREIEQHCGRTFDTVVGVAAAATSRLYATSIPDLLLADDFWTDAGFVLETRTGSSGAWSTWTATEYQLEPLNGVVGGRPGWPYYRIRAVDGERFPTGDGFATIRVTAKWGWQTVPDQVRIATLILAGRLLKRRESPLGLLEFTGDGGSVRVAPLDGEVLRLLQPFVRSERRIGIV